MQSICEVIDKILYGNKRVPLFQGINFALPIMYRVAYVQSLKEMAIEVPEQHAITSGEINFLIGPTPGGGGGALIFCSYAGSGPASTVLPQKISESSSTPKKYLKF